MNGDPTKLRDYVQAVSRRLWDVQDSSQVREIAEKLASEVDPYGRFCLLKLARKTPSRKDSRDTPFRLGHLEPLPRDHKTNEAVVEFQKGIESALRGLEDYHAFVTSNADLSLGGSRDLVLRAVAALDKQNKGQEISFADVQWNSGLTQQQVDDALEHWRNHGLLRADDLPLRHPEGIGWQFWFTSRGRDWAIKGPPAGLDAPPSSLVYEIHNSQIASAGIAQGPITQNVTIYPEVADVVHALLRLEKAADASPDTAAIATLAHEAQQELRSRGWTAKAVALLSAIGGLVQTAASLKPAYQTLQPLAVAHNVPLPLWP